MKAVLVREFGVSANLCDSFFLRWLFLAMIEMGMEESVVAVA